MNCEHPDADEDEEMWNIPVILFPNNGGAHAMSAKADGICS